jgi:hypothetical protein
MNLVTILRRFLPAVLAVLLVALVAAGASAHSGSAHVRPQTAPLPTPLPPLVGSRLVACHQSPLAAKRFATAAITMRALPRASHLAVRIDLYLQQYLQGPHGGRLSPRVQRIVAPGLGTWIEPSDPALGSRPRDVWRFRQTVTDLVPSDGSDLPPSRGYFFRVAFQWRGYKGRQIMATHTLTRPCRQEDLRPDLAMQSVEVVQVAYSDIARYALVVRNLSFRRAARNVAVRARFPQDPASDRTFTIGWIPPRHAYGVTFLAKWCSALDPFPPAFAIDPQNAIEEIDERNNGGVASCPAPPAP